MNSRIIFFEPWNSSSSSISIDKFSIFVIDFLKEPFVLKNGISFMSKSSSFRLFLFSVSFSISPSRSLENLVLYPISGADCWPFCSRFNPSSSA